MQILSWLTSRLFFFDQPFGMHTKSDPRATREPELLDETT
jgi:hypothetical protein